MSEHTDPKICKNRKAISLESKAVTAANNAQPQCTNYAERKKWMDIYISEGGSWICVCPSGKKPDDVVQPCVNKPDETVQPDPKEEQISVTFITPGKDPNGQPEEDSASQDQNHYTYSTSNPGKFSMVLRAKVTPSGKASEAKDRVKFEVEAIEGSMLTWKGDSGGKPTDISGDLLEAEVVFEKLPAKNNGFGKKTAKLYFDGSLVESRVYYVFFPKKAKNHPGSDSTLPNWFYYWQEGNVCGISSSCKYDSTASFGYCQPSSGDTIYLGPDAPDANTGPETYDSGGTTYGKITVTGVGKGIKCVAETIQHEQQHILNYKAKGKTDTDGDGIDDTAEATLCGIKSDPNDPDTFNMGGSYSSYGDDEVRCRKVENELTITYHTDKDWANPGCQSKNKYGPN